jgi:hypothetical protein
MKGRSTLFDRGGAARVSLGVGARGFSGRLTLSW